AGGAKAIMLLGLGWATVGATMAVEGNVLTPRHSTVLVAGLGVVLAAFAALTPSRLSMAGTVAAIGLAPAPLAFRTAGVRGLVGFDRVPAILTAVCIVLALNRLRVAAAFPHAPDMEDIGRTTIAAVRTVMAGQNPYTASIDLHPEYPDFPGYKY